MNNPQFQLVIEPGINKSFQDMPYEHIISKIVDNMLTWTGPSQYDQLRCMTGMDINSACINADGNFEISITNTDGFNIPPSASMHEVHKHFCILATKLAPSHSPMPPSMFVHLRDVKTGICT